MNHTPGPWHIVDGSFWKNTRVIVNWDETCVVGQATFAGYSPQFERCRAEEEEGNAKLMAAAPELLEALVKAKNWMDPDVCLYECMSDHDRNIFGSTLEAINNAIKKATS